MQVGFLARWEVGDEGIEGGRVADERRDGVAAFESLEEDESAGATGCAEDEDLHFFLGNFWVQKNVVWARGLINNKVRRKVLCKAGGRLECDVVHAMMDW